MLLTLPTMELSRVAGANLGPRKGVYVDLLMPSTATDQIYGPDTEGPHGLILSC